MATVTVTTWPDEICNGVGRLVVWLELGKGMAGRVNAPTIAFAALGDHGAPRWV